MVNLQTPRPSTFRPPQYASICLHAAPGGPLGRPAKAFGPEAGGIRPRSVGLSLPNASLGRYYVDYYYGLTDMAAPTIQHVVRNKQRFTRIVRVLITREFQDVSEWLATA